MSVSVPLRLRPLEIGDLLDETFRMYRRHFLLFAGISVILAIPSAALYGLGLAWFSIGLNTTSSASDLGPVTGFLGAIGAAALVNLLFLPFSHSAIVYAACESAIGRPVTASGVFFGVLRRYFPLLGYWVLFNTFTAYLALILCLAPFALWLWGFVLWVAAVPAMFVENIGLGAAIGRSRQLVQGRWWRTFLILFLTYVLYFVVSIALGGFINLAQGLLSIVVSPFIASAVVLGSGQIVAAVLAPIAQIVFVLIYFDLRVRREALDLFQMAYRLSAAQAAT
jgi:hypothetical protein